MGRRIVVHQCMPGAFDSQVFVAGDIVFFDDCLWSQYRFMKDNAASMRGIQAVFGFSSGLVRPDGAEPIRYIDSAVVHAAVNARMESAEDDPPSEINAFMSVGEVREMAQLENVRIALHGCVHLDLRRIPGRIDRLMRFRRDAEDGVRLFREYGFVPGIFVYPYAFCEDGYDYAVKRLGFAETYARPGSYRIQVEDLIDGHTCEEDS